jgi:glycosyltransferase involved in cell wall biosynthesis
MARTYPGLRYHAAASDEAMAALYATARATVFPTIAEGCGLPLLESLWQGVPCVCSDLPVLRENSAGGGCLPVALNDRSKWKATLRRVLTGEGDVCDSHLGGDVAGVAHLGGGGADAAAREADTGLTAARR